MPILCLDPGHQNIPNADTGCMGFGLHEEDIVLDICKRAKPLIEFNGIKVIMTREGATVNGDGSSLNASLNTRCQIANNARADLFLSVHADAYNTQAYGTTAYVYGLGGNAERFAKILNPLMGQIFYNRGIKVANFEVIRDTNMPACLLETAFLDNQGDNAKLADPNVRQQIAVNIAKSVCQYFGISYKEQSTNNNGVNDVLDIAILKYSSEDDWSAKDIDAHLGGVANFTRQGVNKIIPKDAMNAKQLIVIGGLTTGHPNEILLSGKTKYDTAQAVGKYLG